MATKKDSLRRIENIKADLRTISTCTAATASELQQLLVEKAEEQPQKENLRVKASQTLSVQSGGRRKAVAMTVTTTVDAVKQATNCLPPRDKYILATEVVNITLKSLADALKSQPPPSIPPTCSKSKSPTNDKVRPPAKQRAANPKGSSDTHRPLQERSVSHAMNSPRKPLMLRRSTSYSSFLTTGPDPGLLATAECARIAFSYLRTLEAVKTAGKDSPELQLENGILAYIGKLVAHGLDNPAIKELRILKRRLYLFIGAKGEGGSQENRRANGKIEPKKAPIPTEKETLASLLDFGDVNRKSPALPLITNHQIYTLRIIARTRRPRIVEAAWEYLKLSNPSSPVNLIWHTASPPSSQVKVARQLESLAQTVLSLCPSISSSDDVATGEESLQPSPDTVFFLQHLAFQIRRKWWILAKHQGDEERELIEPFLKCLVAFSRRSKLSAVKKYKMAESLYLDLCGPVDESTNKKQSMSVAQVGKSLSSLAQAAGLTDDALRWLGASGSTETLKTSAAKTAARLVRIATLSLDVAIKDKPRYDLENTITTALDALSGSVGGFASDLDSLFLEVNALRRVASRVLTTNASATRSDTATISIVPQALRIISASVRFFTRYIGTQLSASADPKALVQYDDRLFKVSKFTKSILDSVMACCKQPIQSDTQWADLDTLLQDSVCILQHLEKTDTRSEPELPEGLTESFVKVSNAYWAVYLQLRQGSGCPKLIVKTMERSIKLLEGRSYPERQSGLLGMKLEKLGEALDYLGRGEASRDAFLRCLGEIVDGTGLEETTELAATLPIPEVFEASRHASTLGRVLKSYHRSFMKDGVHSPSDMAFFDQDDLPGAARGAMLEWQMTLYLRSLVRIRSWNTALTSSVQQIAKRLLDVYPPATFPVRRKRACVALIQLSQEHPEILPPVLFHSTIQLEIEIQSQTQDVGLARYDGHLASLLKLKLSMQGTAPSVSVFQECLSVWQSLVDSSSSWKDLTSRVHDPEDWIQEMQAIADYLAAKGEEYVCLPTLHLLVKVLELQRHSDPSRLILARCSLAHQLLQLGYTGKAGLAYAKAETLVSHETTSTDAKLRWHIGYAEYLLRIGNPTKCQTTLYAAEAIAKADVEFMGLAKSSTTLTGRVRFNRILADACYVSSLLAIRNGNRTDAAKYAKQCVVLNRRVWSTLEAKINAKRIAQTGSNGPGSEESANSNFDALSSMRSEKGVPLVMSTTHGSLDGAEFWALVPALYRGLMQHSLVFAHEGLLQEAVFVAEQAQKIASATHSRSLMLDNTSRQAELWAQSGRLEKAQPLLKSVDLSKPYKHLAMVGYYSSLARMHHLNKNVEEEFAAYEFMESLLSGLTLPSYIKTIDTFSPSVDSVAEQIAAISLVDSELEPKKVLRSTRGRRPAPIPGPKAAPKVAPRTASRAAPRAASKTPQAVAAKTSNITEECLSLCSLQADVTRRKALANLLQDNVAKASELLALAHSFEKGLDHNVLHLWASFKITLSQSMKELTKNFTFNSLPESTIAFPAISQSMLSEGTTGKRAAAVSSSSLRGNKKVIKDAFVETLREARERLVEAHALCFNAGSSHSFQQASFALGQVTVLLSAVSAGEMRGSLHPLYAAYMSEIPKSNSLRFAQESIEAEQETMSREELLRWPETASSKGANLPSATDFQKLYIDIIPEQWTAVSLALNEECDELYITRYESGQTPFVLRLPMARHTNRDADEEEFTFDNGKQEFEEIIELSDFSTRSAKDVTSREARVQWWEGRNALDNRLRDLLINMENIWLGGFKGMFSQHTRQPTLLARFKKSFENILDRYLPSRQGKKQPKKTTLDTRVLDLFIGLGDATNDALDLDEALMDLIYFVVDILQFNGERNPYDEIEFDAMVIETHDALRAYHDASQSISAHVMHTILILDKNLHAFPWESMPCLQPLSISRLPSLVALRERILAAKGSAAGSDTPPGHYISAEAGGASILNPSGDLTHTLNTIQPHLDELQGTWTHIASRAPTETEFETSLKEKDLVLYFGHGSGGQFVRSKAVRKLYPGEAEREKRPGCATTFLFGCSSVHLSNNGIYEPTGMLASYLVAGAPAVLGMLWDVTDKDCDRFAIRTGELWGLWPEDKHEAESIVPKTPKTAKKIKGKAKASQLTVEVEGARGASAVGRKGRIAKGKLEDNADQISGVAGRKRGVGLDEAVREARDVCVLRYLNGAAAVVYGIPVYLE
ncbi:hypothetical protein K504DRAFT_467582 [Pleomassaria siparia CBS 279.74]|uniref:separase n=1 Tax=Pleomassaria siparia CBS 279.74 TaxID=1314801 RepID=A0A6G1KB78_9PLEO|nr:hypothetical protein K504DRAFT_467582 [Pleomassaria siparia CBS 279.74]